VKKSRAIYLCSPKKVEGTISLPMIKFNLIKDKLDFQECDTLMFTSKQAVYYVNELDKSWKNYPVIAIGSATKKVVQELGGDVIYQPKNYYGKELANGVLKYFKDRKILYIRPKIISFDSKNYLENRGVILKEEIIYETNCIKYSDKTLEKNAIVIFTSPSTIECFFKSFEWDSSYLAVVIGNSTLKKLPSFVRAVVADEATIDSCIKKAKRV
jgi:uroporphyrinogen-III synthase